MIPLATTTVTVTEPGTADLWAEPYGPAGVRTVTASGIRAVIDLAAGTQQVAGGEQAIWDFDLTCDPVPISRLAHVQDDTTGADYRVMSVMTYPQHVEARLRLVEGEV